MAGTGLGTLGSAQGSSLSNHHAQRTTRGLFAPPPAKLEEGKLTCLAWSDRNDARVALTVGLEENIHDGLIDTLRKVYKQLSNPHEKAVVTGGMHTAASTRWGGTQEIVDEAGNMCCPDCGQAQHPTLEHVLWNCDRYAHLRVNSPPSCPLVRRLVGAMKLQSLNLCPYSDKWGRFEKLKSSIECKGSDFSMPAWFEVVAQPSCLVILRSRLVILRSIPAVSASGSGAGACACSGCGRCCGLPTPGSKCCCVQMQTGAGRVSRISLSILLSHLLHVYRLFLHWMTPENAVVFQSSKENRPRRCRQDPLRLKLFSWNKTLVSHLVALATMWRRALWDGPVTVLLWSPGGTERPARALKKKDVKKVQPVWLQVEQKRGCVAPANFCEFVLVEFASEFVSKFVLEVLHNFDAPLLGASLSLWPPMWRPPRSSGGAGAVPWLPRVIPPPFASIPC